MSVRMAPTGDGSAGPGENLWIAASDNDIERVRALMDSEGFTPTSADDTGYTPVHAAAAYAHLDLLTELLQRDGNAANVRASDGDTPLHRMADADDLAED